MRGKILGLLILSAVLVVVGIPRGGAVQSAQPEAWIPLAAKQTEKVYQVSGGEKALISEKTGNYFRNRAGSIYQRSLTVVGQPQSTAHLQDVLSGKVYEINYDSKTVKVLAEGVIAPRRPHTADEFRQHQALNRWLGKKILSGVECEIYKIRPSDDGKTEGEMWVAPALNFLPVQHKILDHEGNVEILVILQEIHAGVDPDPSLFKVPDGFTVE